MPETGKHQRHAVPGWVSGEAGAPVTRLSTRDPDEFREWISTRYTDHERRIRPRARGFAFAAEHGAVHEVRYLRTRYEAAAVDIGCPPMSLVTITRLLSGRAVVRWRGGETRVGHGGTLLVPPTGSDARYDCNDTVTVTVALDALLRTAEELTGLHRGQVRFTDLRPVSGAAQQRWQITADYVRRGVCTGCLDHPLLHAATERLVAASVLATFPNTTMTTEVRTPRDRGTPAIVRRALAFIDAHAGEPITLTDIAAAAGVVPRTLQYAFRRHRDTTPLAHLRRIRLIRAHDDLMAAEPGDGTTVAAVAARWGFARPDRFATAYRRAYHQSPSSTLWR